MPQTGTANCGLCDFEARRIQTPRRNMFTSNQLTNDVAKTSRSRERFEKSSVCSTEQGKSNSVRPSGYTNRPTPQNVGLFAFLRSIHRGLHAPAQSQTLPGAMSLPTQARNGLGAYSAFGTPTLGSLKVARPSMSLRGRIERSQTS